MAWRIWLHWQILPTSDSQKAWLLAMCLLLLVCIKKISLGSFDIIMYSPFNFVILNSFGGASHCCNQIFQVHQQCFYFYFWQVMIDLVKQYFQTVLIFSQDQKFNQIVQDFNQICKHWTWTKLTQYACICQKCQKIWWYKNFS